MHRARIVNVYGKGKTMRTLWLSADAHAALADYLEGGLTTYISAFAAKGEATEALFPCASSVAQPRAPINAERGGRLSVRAVNYHVEKIGDW